MNDSPESEPLRPALREVEAELDQQLEEVCKVENAAPETTAELIRLEEALTDAAVTAKQAVSLRRRLREQSKEDIKTHGGGLRTSAAMAPLAEQERAASAAERAEADKSSAVRELTDRQGRHWRIWAVRPETMQRFTGVEELMGEYRLGWLAFESTDGELRKRLTDYPDDWWSMPAAELERLIDQAQIATRRKPGPGAQPDEPRP